MNRCRISLVDVDPSKNKYPHYRDRDFRNLFGTTRVRPALDFSRADFRAKAREVAKRMSISGVQEKISAHIDNRALTPIGEGGTYILKPSPADFPFAAENEHLGMCISRFLGIRTAECGLISFADGKLAYVTKRFDRTKDGGRIHQEDLLQLLDKPTSGNAKYETSYEETGRVIRKVTDGKMGEVMEFFRRVVHAYLIGNDDMHMKNLSLQRLTPAGTTPTYDRLSPHYDAFSSTIYNTGLPTFFASDLFDDSDGTAYEKYGYFVGADFVDFGRRIGLKEAATQAFLRRLSEKHDAVIDLVGRSHLPKKQKTAVRSLVLDRLDALQRR